MRFLALDAGNSTCHAALFEDRAILASRSWPAAEKPPCAPALGASPGPVLAALCSVNRRADPVLRSWAGEAGVPLKTIPGDVPYPIPVAVLEPGRTGPDRVLAAAAALERASGTCVVVDAGTAVTVDRADPTRGFLGGAILPGLALLAGSLRAGTSLLPEIAPAPVEDPLGRTTEEALAAGVFLGWLGAIRELLARMEARYGPAPVFVTGGDAAHLEGRLPGDVRVVQDLALLGVARAVRAAGTGPNAILTDP